MSWDLVKLGELITESRIPSENPDPDRRITVRLNVLGVEKRALENEKAGATKQFIRKAGQFIYGKQNFHKGAFGIIPDELDGFESSADLPSFDVREDCLSEWIFYFFKQGGYYLELAKIARGIATQRIHPEQIYDLEIPLPDIETQKKIIASIKSIEVKGDKLNKELTYQLTQLENLNQAILQEAVQGKLVKQDPKDLPDQQAGEPASELLKRITSAKLSTGKAAKMNRVGLKPNSTKKTNTLALKGEANIKPEEIPFEIPENWVWCRLGEICSKIGSGSTPKGSNYSKSGFPFFRSQNIYNDGLVYDDIKFVSDEVQKQMNGTIVLANDILLNITGGSMGRCALVPEDFEEGNVSQHVCIIRPLQVDRNYFHKIVLSPYFQKFIFSSTTGAGREGLPKYNLEQFAIPLPPLSEQKRIVEEIEKQFAKTKQLKEHIIANQQATEQLLKALLHQAFEVREVEEVNS